MTLALFEYIDRDQVRVRESWLALNLDLICGLYGVSIGDNIFDIETVRILFVLLPAIVFLQFKIHGRQRDDVFAIVKLGLQLKIIAFIKAILLPLDLLAFRISILNHRLHLSEFVGLRLLHQHLASFVVGEVVTLHELAHEDLPVGVVVPGAPITCSNASL